MTSLIDLLDHHGVEFRRHGENRHVAEGWLGVCCQKCGDNQFKLGINLRTLKASCWQCGRQGTAWVLHLLTNQSLDAVKDELNLVERESIPRRQGGRLVMPEGVGPLTNLHCNYLRGRGLEPKEVEKIWKVQGTVQTGDPAWHLVIPVHVKKEVVAWTARSLCDEGRRYDTAKDEHCRIPIKHTLYGADLAGNAVVVVEGPLDVWKVGPGTVCTYGTAYTPAQVLLLSRYPKRVICFDSEPDAQRRAKELASQLACFDGETVNVLLDAKDAGEASSHEITMLRKEIE